jgi:hypothetical protein
MGFDMICIELNWFGTESTGRHLYYNYVRQWPLSQVYSMELALFMSSGD